MDSWELRYRLISGQLLCAAGTQRVLAGAQMSNKRVSCDKTKETSTKILTLQERTISQVLRQKWFVGDNHLYLIFRVKLTPFLRKRRYLTEFR